MADNETQENAEVEPETTEAPATPGDASAPIEPAPEAVLEAVADTVRLALVAPWYCQSFGTVDSAGDSLVIDKNGTVVQADAAKAIVKAAARAGVTLKIGK